MVETRASIQTSTRVSITPSGFSSVQSFGASGRIVRRGWLDTSAWRLLRSASSLVQGSIASSALQFFISVNPLREETTTPDVGSPMTRLSCKRTSSQVNRDSDSWNP